MHIMYTVPSIAFEVVTCLAQLFDLYYFAVSTDAGIILDAFLCCVIVILIGFICRCVLTLAVIS